MQAHRTHVRAATRREVEDVSRLHVSAFPESFLSALGPRVLSSYYEVLVRDDLSIVIGAWDRDCALVGFAAGTFRSSGMARKLAKTALLGGWTALKLIAQGRLRPGPLLDAAMMATRRDSSARQAKSLSPGRLAELSSIGVDPMARGKGVGALLLGEFAGHACRSGASGVVLYTDAHENERVHEFYTAGGFTEVDRRRRPSGRVISTYYKAFERLSG